MKDAIHPKYEETTYTCSCGNTFSSHSTKGGKLHIELCNECHPFFTGQQKLIDTGGRVQRFADKFGAAAATALEKEKAAAEARRAAAEAREEELRASREQKSADKAKKAAEYAASAPVAAPVEEATEEVVAEEAAAEEASAE